MLELYAHYDKETGEKQLLINHLENVANDAASVAKKIGQADTLFLIGVFHDLGKGDPLFQNMMLNQTKMHVNHSSAGATYLSKTMPKILSKYIKPEQYLNIQPFLEVVCYVITSHHGLYDIPSDLPKFGNNQFFKRLNYDKEDKAYSFHPNITQLGERLETTVIKKYYPSFTQLVIKSFQNFCQLWNQVKSKETSENQFYLGLMVRLYLSILKNADIKDTINAYSEKLLSSSDEPKTDFADYYVKQIEEKYTSFGNSTTVMNQIRMEIAGQLQKRGIEDKAGIYRLNLPTGAGKTLLSMRYGFNQMKEQSKDRFIYIAPYLSILEQNANEIKEIVKGSGVLEHHSNAIQTSEKEKDQDFSEVSINYLVETWDSPIVLSTMVQFFQTLFKGKSSNIRRFSQLINSVIILDEVQSLPVEVTTVFNLTMNFLKSAMNTTIVLCTATQPTYSSESLRHRLSYGDRLGRNSELVQLTLKQRSIFERTEISKFREDNSEVNLQAIFDDLVDRENQSILVILNTKKAVKKLYELASTLPRPVFHLSTNMCAQHRVNLINDIKERIKEEALICISTQLIEAGVDLDFDCVIRSYAGIDSIVQAAGRCNREGLKPKGYVKLANVVDTEESLIRLPAIKKKKEVTEQIVRKKASPISITELNDEFFERYYSNTKPADFDYPTGKDEPTVYEYLSEAKNNFVVNQAILKQSFKTAAEKMDLIQDESQGVFVYYDEGIERINLLIEKINEYQETYDPDLLKNIKESLKVLQPFTVNLRRSNPYEDAITTYLDGSIRILQEDYYNKNTGIIERMSEYIF